MPQSTILDHTRDLSGTETHRLTSLYTPPEFVKQASHDQLHGDPAELPPTVYGGITERVYPCHTKAATWISALFFQDKHREIAPSVAEQIKNRITKSASYWNIQGEVEALWEKMAADVANGHAALTDDQFALVWEAEGRKERHYPINTPANVKMASTWFGSYHREFNYADKHTIASKILVKAAEFGTPCDNQELLDRCAGFGYCAAETAAQAWEKRANLAAQRFPDYAQEAWTMASTIRGATFEARDQGKRVKMAECMDQFDRQTELHHLYDEGGLPRPEDELFQITEKVAGDFLKNHVQTTTGAIYEKNALASLSPDVIQQWMGDDMVDACGGAMLDVEKMAEIVPTLPRGDAEMFERMTTAAGIPTFAREKAAHDQGLTREEMQALATQYGQEQSLKADAALI